MALNHMLKLRSIGASRLLATQQVFPSSRRYISETGSLFDGEAEEIDHSACNHNFKLPIDDKELKNIFGQNEEWRQEKMKEDPDFFNKLGAVHQPRFLWIGCADARVPANSIMGEAAGNVFVHRNVGNQVLNTDMSILSTIQYAVDYLKIPHIIVCGHYDCGAVKAASKNKNHGAPIENWLTSIRDVQRMHRHELLRLPDSLARERRLVELNVIEGCLNVFKTPTVQKKRVETSKDGSFPFTAPQIHALVFDPAVGKLQRLDVDFKSLLTENASVYDIEGKNSEGYEA